MAVGSLPDEKGTIRLIGLFLPRKMTNAPESQGAAIRNHPAYKNRY
jgi:hypothetical protein